ncbi:MAG: hypothetical protein WC752_01910 [Patescibacteria group bacterium]|jgi:hypothetical protein
MNYGDILKKSYQLTKKYKILWLLGLLIGGGSSYSGNYSFSGLGDSELGNDLTNEFDFSIIQDYWYIVAVLMLLVLLFVLVAAVISIMARGGLFHGVHQAQEDKKPSFKESFYVGAGKFWRVLSIQLAMVAVIGAVICVLIIPAALLMIIPVIGWVIGGLLLIVAILLIIVLSLTFALLSNYIYCYAVIENQTIVQSIKSGWALLKKNLGESIIMALIIYGIGFGAALVIIFSLILILAIFGGVGFLLYLAFKWIGVGIAAAIALIVLMVIGLLLRGVLNVFTYSCWVYTFKELKGK